MNSPHSIQAQDVALQLSTDTNEGLLINDAQKRLIQYGLNSLNQDKSAPFIKRLINHFFDSMVLILIAAAVLSAFIAIREEGHQGWIDVGVILAIVLINAFLGIYQEGKADRALAELKRMSSPQSKVIRSGEFLVLPSEQLVPGDVVCVEPGDLVAADVRLFWQQSLRVDESSLTGESTPVDKLADVSLDERTGVSDRKNMLFMGTAVTYGKGKGIVTATGSATEIGHVASQLQRMDDEQTPLQKSLNALGRALGVVCILACVFVFGVDIFLQQTPWEESLMIAVTLAVAAIPEGLAAVVTIVLAIGMTRMSSRNAIVRKLLAVETLGCVDVICSDKTGTLTQNVMTVRSLYCAGKEYLVSGIGYSPDGHVLHEKRPIDLSNNKALKMMMLNALLCNDAMIYADQDQQYSCIGDPTEGALVTLGRKANLNAMDIRSQFPRIAELPFDSDRKMMTSCHTDIENCPLISFTKGAPEIILSRCTYYHDGQQAVPMTSKKRAEISAQNILFSKKALRVLAFAYKQCENQMNEERCVGTADEDNMVFLGLVGMVDPARADVKDAIIKCKEAGIRPVMITGDYKETALAIAEELGIIQKGEKGLSGHEIDQLSDEDLVDVCEKVNVYSRVSPDHKVRIVSALKKNNHIVSMTGGGVNDAMALKTADIGVAMGMKGTEVAKNSSDMILKDDSFTTIIHAVEDGRVIYSNIRKLVSFLLSCNVGEILVIFIISLIPVAFFNQSGTYLMTVVPLTVIQLLWLNLVTDSLPALALGREKPEPDIMKQLPRRRNERIINGHMRWTIVVQSLAIFSAVFCAFLLGIYVFFKDTTLRLEGARTMAFATLILAELFRAYSARSERVSVFKMKLLSNRHMNFAVVVSVLLLFAAIYLPGLKQIFRNVSLPLQAWIPMIILAIIPFAIGESYKMLRACEKNQARRRMCEENE